MSYTDDAMLAKLSALNESHDSIATAAQWIMFHKRHADRTVQLWLQKLKESPSPKRLNLIYLANEVTQQLKARQKLDFVIAFSPIIAEATSVAYKGATQEVQGKIRRVTDVWRQRNIFDPAIQTAVEARMDEIDKARGVTRASNAASAGMSSSMPSELAPLVIPQQTVAKLQISTAAAVSTAEQEYEKQNDTKQPTPSAPVYAARLNGLLKTLATAEGAVAQCVKARQDLLNGLQKLLNTHKASLEKEEKQLEELRTRKDMTDNKKKDVEAAIMRGLVDQDVTSSNGAGAASPGVELDRPEMEALTPPADEPEPEPSTTPPGDGPVATEPAVVPVQAPEPVTLPGINLMNSIPAHYQSTPVSTNGSNKRRRVDSDNDFVGLDNDGIDPNIDAMIQN